uniref:Uncharacterized protein AlNc14C475G11855 n=1 Tax=Albugo laibachii Nc14 TaxID=890382 RepID=F0X0B8_9STRA|nr:conserved hypothetical protein [Albugo laibachii Nc14]|eukprot:CCA27201.1 conserved hypothetical protein [Albugo laibachii Nc14]
MIEPAYSDVFSMNEDELLSLPSDQSPENRNQKSGPDVPSLVIHNTYRGRCRYISQKCENERALKRNGQPHNLCEKHRKRQNEHQRRFDDRLLRRKPPKSTKVDSDQVPSNELRVIRLKSPLADIYACWRVPQYCTVKKRTNPSTSTSRLSVPIEGITSSHLSNQLAGSKRSASCAGWSLQTTGSSAMIPNGLSSHRNRIQFRPVPPLSTDLFGFELYESFANYHPMKKVTLSASRILEQSDCLHQPFLRS